MEIEGPLLGSDAWSRGAMAAGWWRMQLCSEMDRTTLSAGLRVPVGVWREEGVVVAQKEKHSGACDLRGLSCPWGCHREIWEGTWAGRSLRQVGETGVSIVCTQMMFGAEGGDELTPGGYREMMGLHLEGLLY